MHAQDRCGWDRFRGRFLIAMTLGIPALAIAGVRPPLPEAGVSAPTKPVGRDEMPPVATAEVEDLGWLEPIRAELAAIGAVYICLERYPERPALYQFRCELRGKTPESQVNLQVVSDSAKAAAAQVRQQAREWVARNRSEF